MTAYDALGHVAEVHLRGTVHQDDAGLYLTDPQGPPLEPAARRPRHPDTRPGCGPMSAADRPCDCPAVAHGQHQISEHEQDCGCAQADGHCGCWACLAEGTAYHQVLFSRTWRRA
jgi:hypothetical protein